MTMRRLPFYISLREDEHLFTPTMHSLSRLNSNHLFKNPHHHPPLLHSIHSHSNPPSNLSQLLQGRLRPRHLLQIHAQVFLRGAHQNNLIATRLIGNYPPQFSLRVFNHLQSPNIFPFNAIIRVLAEEGLYSNAFSVFKHLLFRSLVPNDLTFSFLLKACSRSDDVNYVSQVHAHVFKLGYVGDPFVCNAIIGVYAKRVQDLVAARKLFDEMTELEFVSCWTSLISGFAQSGESEEVLRLFSLMVEKNLRPSVDTMVSVLSACSNLAITCLDKWVQVLSKLDSKKVGSDSVNTVLVYLYGKWGKVDKSRQKFDEISDDGKRSVVPWNTMISVYAQNGFSMEALSLFRLMMENHNCSPNHVTMVSVLSACAQIGDLDLGMWVHEYLISNGRNGLLSLNKILATALIDMYLKCGSLQRARDVFEGIATKDVVLCNAMIMGLATNGKEDEALRLFYKMQEIGLRPNGGTFVGVLCACSHSGLLEKGRQIFANMSAHFCVHPNLEHYACYIDLLARVGHVEEALDVVTSMPFEPNAFVLGALLGGCLLHNRLELANDISRALVKVDPENSGGYVMLSNAFAVDRRWGDVSRLRWLMKEKGVMKQPGSSWISINGVVHEFLAGSPSHHQVGLVFDTVDKLMQEMKLENS